MRGENGELRFGNELVECGPGNVACESHILHSRFGNSGFQFSPKRSVPREHKPQMRKTSRCGNYVLHSLLSRQPSKEKNRPLASGMLQGAPGNALKVRKDFDLLRIPAVLDELLLHKFAGSDNRIDAAGVATDPAVDITLDCEKSPSTARTRITPLANNIPEPSAF